MMHDSNRRYFFSFRGTFFLDASLKISYNGNINNRER